MIAAVPITIVVPRKANVTQVVKQSHNSYSTRFGLIMIIYTLTWKEFFLLNFSI